jgi:hypothetical protein
VKNFNAQPSVIKVLDKDGTASQSSDKVDFRMIKEIVILPLEPGVRLLFNFEDDISRLNAWCLVALSSKFDLVATLHTAIDMDM